MAKLYAHHTRFNQAQRFGVKLIALKCVTGPGRCRMSRTPEAPGILGTAKRRKSLCPSLSMVIWKCIWKLTSCKKNTRVCISIYPSGRKIQSVGSLQIFFVFRFCLIRNLFYFFRFSLSIHCFIWCDFHFLKKISKVTWKYRFGGTSKSVLCGLSTSTVFLILRISF